VSGFEIYGRVIDPFTVKLALRDTLQTWLKHHLPVQADRYGLPPTAFPLPKTWPKGISDFDVALEQQLPSIVIVQHGGQANPRRNQRGEYAKTWQFDVRAAVAGKTEEDAEKLASVYLAAITSALVQNGTLGGLAKSTTPVGPDSYDIGTSRAQGQARAQRAVYGSIFAVEVRNVVTDMAGPDTPPPDPYDPPAPPAPLETTGVTVTSLPLEDTP
jgi:hypothetical protein